jgi:hypothetical protein
MNIIQALQGKENLLNGDGVEESVVVAAERELNLKFAADYREYLLRMTIAAYDGHEFTGLSKAVRTNVVEVTKQKWLECSKISKSWYVIEETNIDQIVIWQSQDGKVYETIGGSEPVCVADSMIAFVMNMK